MTEPARYSDAVKFTAIFSKIYPPKLSLALSQSNFGINSNFWNQIFSHSAQLQASPQTVGKRKWDCRISNKKNCKKRQNKQKFDSNVFSMFRGTQSTGYLICKNPTRINILSLQQSLCNTGYSVINLLTNHYKYF